MKYIIPPKAYLVPTSQGYRPRKCAAHALRTCLFGRSFEIIQEISDAGVTYQNVKEDSRKEREVIYQSLRQ